MPRPKNIEMPTEDVVLNIIDFLESDDILRLRQLSRTGELPEWLHIIMSDRVLYRALQRYNLQSVRPPLSHFNGTPTGRLELRQMEQTMIQHIKGCPLRQTKLRIRDHAIISGCRIQGQFVAFSAGVGPSDAEVVVLVDLLQQKMISIPLSERLRALVLTDTLFAFADGSHFKVVRLADIDFNNGIAPQMRSQELHVLSLAGKHNEIAIHAFNGRPPQDYTRSIRVYDYTTDSMSTPINRSAQELFWDEELWIIDADTTEKSRVRLTFASTSRTYVVSTDRPKMALHNLTVRKTGDKIQVALYWECWESTDELHQSLILDDFQLVTTITGRCKVWRGNRYFPQDEIGIHIEDDDDIMVGQLRKNRVRDQEIATNDTFLVVISNDHDNETMEIVTMPFDQSIDLGGRISEQGSDFDYWWKPGPK